MRAAIATSLSAVILLLPFAVAGQVSCNTPGANQQTCIPTGTTVTSPTGLLTCGQPGAIDGLCIPSENTAVPASAPAAIPSAAAPNTTTYFAQTINCPAPSVPIGPGTRAAATAAGIPLSSQCWIPSNNVVGQAAGAAKQFLMQHATKNSNIACLNAQFAENVSKLMQSGVPGGIPMIVDAYRPAAAQTAIFQSGTGATQATACNSYHQYGLAVDFAGNSSVLQYLRVNAPKFELSPIETLNPLTGCSKLAGSTFCDAGHIQMTGSLPPRNQCMVTCNSTTGNGALTAPSGFSIPNPNNQPDDANANGNYRTNTNNTGLLSNNSGMGNMMQTMMGTQMVQILGGLLGKMFAPTTNTSGSAVAATPITAPAATITPTAATSATGGTGGASAIDQLLQQLNGVPATTPSNTSAATTATPVSVSTSSMGSLESTTSLNFSSATTSASSSDMSSALGTIAVQLGNASTSLAAASSTGSIPALSSAISYMQSALSSIVSFVAHFFGQ